MKPSLSLTLALTSVLLAGFPLGSAGQSLTQSKLTDQQRTVIKERLTNLITDVGEVTVQKNSSLTETFLKASESERAALEFYLQCVEYVDYTRAGGSGTDFRAWKAANEARLENDEFAEALQILLRYLAISTEAERTEDMETVFPLLTKYIDGIASLDEIPLAGGGGPRGGGGRGPGGRGGRGGGGGNQSPLDQPIYDSVFAERYDLFEELRRRDRQDDAAEQEDRDTGRKHARWESMPLRIGGMYEKTILPYLMQEAPEKVLAAWTKRISQEASMSTVRGDAAEEKFKREDYPQLQFDMAKDQFRIGDEVNGAAKMLEHIEEHKSTHPKASDWIEEAIALIFPATDSTYRSESPRKNNPFEGLKLGE